MEFKHDPECNRQDIVLRGKPKQVKHVPVYFGVMNITTNDHDDMAGYGGRIGYRYKTTVTVQFSSKAWNAAKVNKQIGGTCVDVANHLYSAFGFKQTYNPQVDTKARGKAGTTVVTFDYFHNSDEDASVMEYSGRWMKHHTEYLGRADQVSLDCNNKASYDAMLDDLNDKMKE